MPYLSSSFTPALVVFIHALCRRHPCPVVNGRLRVRIFGQCRSERAGLDVAGVIISVRRYENKKSGQTLCARPPRS
jgi:hypothetical protein